ncbi:MAG TPA: hypothetical protein VFL42_05830 [Terriglobales bacterium]|jgi:hypothetical protein|nr:hypothetical protein [Terriglobales bacterium]
MNDANIPVDVLERKAAEQREQLHTSVSELRHGVRERLDVKRNVRDHLPTVAGALLIFGAALGYAVTGVFTRD